MRDSAATEETIAPYDLSGGAVVAFAFEERRLGRQAAIATLVGIDGAAPRDIGAQMAIAKDGRFVGSISSGCLERAIVQEARAAMARGAGGTVRYGKDSRFLDIVLPCGSGLDILYTVDPEVEALDLAQAARLARRPFSLAFGPKGALLADAADADHPFVRRYEPAPRIVAAGHGEELVALSRVAAAAGLAFTAVSPDAETLARCVGEEKLRLVSVASPPAIRIDAWTAVIFLFHDRDWERALIPPALASPAFQIGAVGSRRTQDARLQMLREADIDEALVARLEGPVGLIPATRDPASLAVSILAGTLAAWSARPRP